jgi:hypothetical protein
VTVLPDPSPYIAECLVRVSASTPMWVRFNHSAHRDQLHRMSLPANTLKCMSDMALREVREDFLDIGWDLGPEILEVDVLSLFPEEDLNGALRTVAGGALILDISED